MNRIQQEKYGEWLASIIGAGLVAGAIGAMLPKQSSQVIAAVLIGGALLHFWGMTRIHSETEGCNDSARYLTFEEETNMNTNNDTRLRIATSTIRKWVSQS